jgi:hypothetical protein
MIVDFTYGYNLVVCMFYCFICGRNIDPLTLIYIKY